MNVVIMGPPGVGKGTQSHAIVTSKGTVHISTGDILRMAIRSGSELGLKVHAVMNAGDLVSDELMMELVRERGRMGLRTYGVGVQSLAGSGVP